ncbi:hypothetical protein [Micromonospora sp. WMMD737]|uniref:hypothetical protein n=1 Tax=Micromonospora sp. WMMD737 TaxID=3404113 RepID=UPI003B93D3A3
MSSACRTCGNQVIHAREIDGHQLSLDATAVPDGDVVIYGDPAEPTALWSVDPDGEEMPWGTVIPAGAPRYRKHACCDCRCHRPGVRVRHMTPCCRRPANGNLPDPATLVAAMGTAGFTIAGQGRYHVRFRWPAGRHDRSLAVGTDTTAPEYPTMVAGLLAQLEDAERDGQAARAVIDIITTRPEDPRDDRS